MSIAPNCLKIAPSVVFIQPGLEAGVPFSLGRVPYSGRSLASDAALAHSLQLHVEQPHVLRAPAHVALQGDD
jgi:hypothetical protein